MFEAIQYLVSSKKLEDGFGMDNVVVVNGMTPSCRTIFRLLAHVSLLQYN